MESDSVRFRLRTMMFGQYLIMGAWVVTLPTFLMASPLKGGMNFPATSAAWIYATLAIAGIIAPLFVGLLADRLFSAQRLMAFLHFVGFGLLLAAGFWCGRQQPRMLELYQQLSAHEWAEGRTLYEWEHQLHALPGSIDEEQRALLRAAIRDVNASPEVRQLVSETFATLFGIMLAYAFCNIISITLSNVIAFRNLRDPKRSFGSVRLFGTLGWIVAGVQLDLFWNTVSPAPLFISGAISLVFGVYCFFLPPTPPAGPGRSFGEAVGLPALAMFRVPSFCVLIFCALVMAGVQQFYSVYTNRFLSELGVPRPTAVQTLAQVSELACMLLFPLALSRLGMKWTMALGLLGWVFRNAVFATLSAPLVVAVGLPLHGLSYAFFFLVSSVYIDRQAPPQLRASAQAIFTFVSMGAGTLIGNGISSRIVEQHALGHTVAWTWVWLIPTFVSTTIFLLFSTCFRANEEGPAQA